MTESASVRPVSVNPPLYKQALVGILVGGTLGPAVDWFIGTFATLYTVFLSDNLQNGAGSARGMLGSAFLGGLLGILLVLVTVPLVGLPMRIAASTNIKSLTNFWVSATIGAAVGLGIGYLIHLFWDPSADSRSTRLIMERKSRAVDPISCLRFPFPTMTPPNIPDITGKAAL